MMFARESDMAAPAAEWMRAGGLTVKPEFVTPWGMVDLVGLAWNPERVERRRRLRQTRAIGSITCAVVLLRIPENAEMGLITRARLVRELAPAIPVEVVFEQVNWLIGGHFVVSHPRGQLQRVGGWHPLQDRLVAVELKLSRIGEAMRQALSNLGFAQESYVGLPIETARHVVSDAARWSGFLDAGVGLLGVTRRGCEVLVEADRLKAQGRSNEAVQLYCVEKFWRTRARDGRRA